MKERPILFSAPMVRAILAGTKTQTRRVVGGLHPDCHSVRPFGIDFKFYDPFGRLTQATRCPYGQPGDRLWVREAWAVPHRYDHLGPSNIPVLGVRTHYAATEERGGLRWRPSIHMCRWASRITLEVTGVRVERLQDISEADAAAEGIPHSEVSPPDMDTFAFRHLWESINGPGSWDANPWVWVVEFKRAQPEGGA